MENVLLTHVPYSLNEKLKMHQMSCLLFCSWSYYSEMRCEVGPKQLTLRTLNNKINGVGCYFFYTDSLAKTCLFGSKI